MPEKSKEDTTLSELLIAATEALPNAKCTVKTENGEEECTNEALLAAAFFVAGTGADLVACAEHLPMLVKLAEVAAEASLEAEKRWRQEQETQ